VAKGGKRSFNLKIADFLVTAAVFVFYRTPTPDTATLQQVRTILEQNNMDYTQLVDDSADHCQEVEAFANSTSL
jgi:hypothetical protein